MGLRRAPRPRGTVRAALVEVGVELARSGGPDRVVLREVTRMVGVVPNAAYRHLHDRDALLPAVSDAAIRRLAQRMAPRGAPRACAPGRDRWPPLVGASAHRVPKARLGWLIKTLVKDN